MIRLEARIREPEIMDDPGLDAAVHALALVALTRINRVSRSTGILWRAIRTFAAHAPPATLRLLDVATGAGDVPIELWSRARRAGLRLAIDACDVSSTALAYARQKAAGVGADIRFFPLDVLHEPIPGSYDIITCSLFLHHLDERQAATLLHDMASATSRLLLVNDLHRRRTSLMAVCLATRLLVRSPVVRTDALRSIRAAYTRAELRALAVAGGLPDARVASRWPARLSLEWRRA